MRVLIASTRGAGHLNPLLPFAAAFKRAGHEVLVAGPQAIAPAVVAAGHAFWLFDDPAPAELGAVWSTVPALTEDGQNRVVIGEVFARLEAAASLPRLRQAMNDWKPDVVVRDPSQYGSAVAADAAGVPHVRVATGLASAEDFAIGVAAPAVDELRRSIGLPADPHGARLRCSPYLTMFPASFEDPDAPVQPDTRRFRDPAWDAPARALPADWWQDADARSPLVYVTFGTVAGAMPMAAAVYERALRAVADLPIRVLMTAGHGTDLDSLGEIPPNVHVERWVPQADALAAADAVVCHAGSGSTLGALAAGLPIVAVPLFADQPLNAARIGAIGAGIRTAPDVATISTAVESVLTFEVYGASARRIAAEMRRQSAVEQAAGGLSQPTAATVRRTAERPLRAA